MLSAGLGNVSFSWMSSPASIELEMTVMNWVANMFDLPEVFKFGKGYGGGMTQASASDSTLISVLSAKAKAIHDHRKDNHDAKEDEVMSRLIAYSSEQAHICGHRAAMLAGVKFRAKAVPWPHP